MALKLGSTDINKLYLGASVINKAYLGATQIFGGVLPPLPVQLGATFAYNFVGVNAATDLIQGATNVNVAGWTDITANNNDAAQSTPAAQPTFTQTDGPISFDGNDRLSCGVHAVADKFTVVFRATSNFNDFDMFVVNKDQSQHDGVAIFMMSTTELGIRGSSETTFVPTIAITSNKTVAVVFNGALASAYVDGVFHSSGAIDPAVVGTREVTLGNRPTNNTNELVGSMDVAYLFPTDLTAQNITDLKTYIEAL